jgi:hypothetical protein
MFSVKSELFLATLCWEMLAIVSRIKLVYKRLKDLGGKVMVKMNNSIKKADKMSGTYFILNVVL